MAHEKLSPRQKMIGMMYLVLTAMLAYLAAEDPTFMPRDKRQNMINPRTGQTMSWPACEKACVAKVTKGRSL